MTKNEQAMNASKYELTNTLSLRKYIFNLLKYIDYHIKKHFSQISKSPFKFNNRYYNYFIHPYNSTWKNERAIEIPIIYQELNSSNTDNVLEIGNVLPHYMETSHLVLDKYEKSSYPHLISQGILEFNPVERFELIISISTIEHVGYDDSPFIQNGFIIALRKVQKLLSDKGKAIITLPVGYNLYLDEAIATKKIILEHVTCMKRVNAQNQWEQVPLAEAVGSHYGHPFPAANSILIVTLFKDSTLE